MEFEEMKKVWDSQNEETLYVINEDAMYRSVISKRKSTGRVINKNEIGLLIINTGVGFLLLFDALFHQEHIWDYLMSALMFLTVIYLFFSRKKRKTDKQQFDRSVLGEINHAIANAMASKQLASQMLWWYILPVGVLVTIKMSYSETSLNQWLITIGMILLGSILTRWELQRCHKPRLEKLERLKEKLVEESEH